MRLFDRFDKVYCINLKRRPDRLQSFENQVNKYNLGNFEVFYAYDGKNLDLSNYKSNLKPGELGLVLSNIDIINNCKKNNYKSVLIMEDDCFFTNEIVNIDSYFENLPSDWDMIYMGGNHNTHMGITPPIKINSKVSKLHSTYSTHFVGINSRIFDEILVNINKLCEPLDLSYVKLQKIKNVYSFYPAIAKQIVDFSDIQNNITDYNWLIK